MSSPPSRESWRLTAAAALLLLLSVTWACGPGPDRERGETASTSLLPGNGPLPGWRSEGPVETVTAGGLYDRIDGGAEVFLQEGFERLLVRDYTDGAEEIEAQLFLLGTSGGARKVWERQGRTGGTMKGLPGPVSVDRYQLVALLDRCYLVVDNLSGGETARAAMEALAREVAMETTEVCGG
ncbi:MAG: hypothetical protein GXP47_13770 [Acidobacteria bacterium]|nr:hypothetical protein [Acidobacteriota bacterium]